MKFLFACVYNVNALWQESSVGMLIQNWYGLYCRKRYLGYCGKRSWITAVVDCCTLHKVKLQFLCRPFLTLIYTLFVFIYRAILPRGLTVLSSFFPVYGGGSTPEGKILMSYFLLRLRLHLYRIFPQIFLPCC